MDVAFSWSTAAWYAAFTVFVNAHLVHSRQFRGASRNFAAALSSLLGCAVGLGYLVAYGWMVSWLAAGGLVVVSILARVGSVVLERTVEQWVLSLVAFAGWPVCAYFMFEQLPG